MDHELLANSPIGQLVPIRGNDSRYGPFACFAYLPSDLPGSVDVDMGTISAITEASGALSRLDQACSQLRDPELLIRPALFREALDTSALEGTYGQLTELLEAELSETSFGSPETREILGYVLAARNAFQSIQERKLTIGLLADAQGEMFKGNESAPSDVGRVRQRQVWIGPEDMSILDARFVPVPGDDRLLAALDNWVQWVEVEHDWPIVLRTALAHYQFEALHPFSDGNGRIGRLAVVLQLLRSGIIKRPAITISPWLVRHRGEYQDQLFAVSRTGDWNPWVRFFCTAIVDQCLALIAGAEKLNSWLDESRALVNEHRWAGRIHDVLTDLTQWPMVTISSVTKRYRVTPTAATSIVNHLVEVGIVTEVTGRNYGRVYCAQAVMGIVDAI